MARGLQNSNRDTTATVVPIGGQAAHQGRSAPHGAVSFAKLPELRPHARGGLFKMLLTIGRLRLSPEYAGRPELAFSMRSEPLCG
jgi:hypothetical protein